LRRLLPILFIISLIACSQAELTTHEPELVVEGYIDDGGYPVVMLTTSLPVNTDGFSFDSLSTHLLRWAKVTVSDGEQETILTGMVDRRYFPPFIYTTTRMEGQAGKTYRLTVDYDKFHATAVTTIPQPPAVDSFKVEEIMADSLYRITACFTDNPAERNYYKLFMRRGRYGRQWLSCYLGVVSDEVLNGYTEIPVNRGDLVTDTLDYSPYFYPSDSVTIKFAQIDEAAYRFWNDYENYDSFGRNPLFPLSKSLHSNIQGGLGCWYGCGAYIQSFAITDYIKKSTQ